MGFKSHFIGIVLLITALSSLAALPLLPQSGHREYALPFLPETGSPYHLAFAGYPGCGTVCPTSMAVLKRVVETLESKSNSPVPDVTFVNIERDTPSAVSERYAKSWHNGFFAYSISTAEAAEIYRELSVRSYAPHENPSNHLGLIYLFHKENGSWNIGKVYMQTPAVDDIINDLQELVSA